MSFKKFRSLLFRELRLSRKMTLLHLGLLMLLILMSWGMLMSVDEIATIMDVLFLMTAMLASMTLMLDENFKSDVNSGWLVYSYTLPIKPFERAAARFVRINGMCLINLGLSLANCAALCAYLGKPFGANWLVWHIVIFAMITIFALPNELILLRVRSAAELKKAQNTAGLASVGIMVVLIAALWMLSGKSLSDLTGGENLFTLPTFTAGDLAWALPLLLAVMAVSFAVSCNSLKTAFSGSKPKEAAASETQTFTAKAGVVKGMMYKELRQNRLVLILAAAAPFLLTAFPFCFAAIGVITGETSVDEMFVMMTNPFIRVLMCIAGIFAVSGLTSEVFRGDDRKLWVYFVISSPRGVKGYMYCKYAVTLLVMTVYTAAGIVADRTLEAVKYLVTGYMPSSSGMMPFYGWGVVALLLISAIDIPFSVRFGSKKGSIIKMISMLLLCGAAVTTFSLLPESAQESVMNFFISLADKKNGLLTVIRIAFPIVAAAAFALSCRISRGVFVKGAEGYDK